jgi:hypothetical protein
MRIDEAWQQGLATAIDGTGDLGLVELGAIENRFYLAVVADHQRVEMLQLPVGADLNAVDVMNERIGEERRGEQRQREREE